MTRMHVGSFRSGILLLGAFSLLGCQDDAASGASDAARGAEATAEAAAAPEPGGARGGAWAGEVTGGYTGNRLSFTMGEDGATAGDILFEGHWDCADGIETTTSGPSGTFPIENGRLEITSVDPPDGGATATRFVLAGTFADGRATGTLRVNINALGCDTGELAWSAAPVAG